MHYLTGLDREQAQIFTKLEDLVSARHYVRLIDLLAERFFIENDSIFCEKRRTKHWTEGLFTCLLIKTLHRTVT